MSVHATSIKEVVTRDDGTPVCPKCGEEFDKMDQWMDHVDTVHRPIEEWVQRWTDWVNGPTPDE